MPHASNLINPNDGLPGQLIAGDKRTFNVGSTAFKSTDGWSMTYVLQGINTIKITGEGNGDSFDFTISADKLARWEAQTAGYALIAKKGNDRKVIAQGPVIIYANPENVDYTARLREIEADLKALNKIKSEIARTGMAGKAFGGKRFDVRSLDELLILETILLDERYVLTYGHSLAIQSIHTTFDYVE